MDRTIVEKAHELIGLCVAYEDKYRSSERPGQALEIAELRMAVEAALLPRGSKAFDPCEGIETCWEHTKEQPKT